MDISKRSYEITVWRDIFSSEGVSEQQIATIGSSASDAMSGAHNIKFKRNINGTNELSFDLYRHYRDPLTGVKTTNPLIDLINNETKIKLKYKNKWYDLLVKNVTQNSTNDTCSYVATDLHIIELSKNGYDLVLDTSLMNNMGTVDELAKAILSDTDWKVESEILHQFVEEPLAIMLTPEGESVYVPYSSLKNKPEYFQYFNVLTPDTDGVIRGAEKQSYVRITEAIKYVTDETASKFGFYYPGTWQYVGLTMIRGERLVYTHKSKFNPALNRVVYYYNGGEIAGYTSTEIVSPNLIVNLVTNNSFKSAEGWKGGYLCAETEENANQGSELNAKIEATTFPSMTEALKNGTFNVDTEYVPYLKITLPGSESCVINSGFYDNRKTLGNVSANEKFVLFYKETNNTPFRITIAAYPYSVSGGHYVIGETPLLVFNSSNAKSYPTDDPKFQGYKYICAEVNASYNLSDKQFQKLKTQLFLSGMSGAEYAFYDLQLFRYAEEVMKGENSQPILPSSYAQEASLITNYWYYNVNDNPEDASAAGYKATASEYVYCAKQLTPSTNYEPEYTTETIRSIDVKGSNYFNAIQSLCEAFECWADFVIEHDANGYITQKKVVIRKYIGQQNHFGFRYGVNLKSAKRTLDSKAIVTKLIVPDNSNQYAPNGFCSISRAGGNPSGENHIYNFQYYVNMGMISRTVLDDVFYNSMDGEAGFFTQLLAINNELNLTIDKFAQLAGPMAAAESAKTVAESGKIASEEQYEEAAESFLKLAGYAHTELKKEGLDEEEIAKREEQLAQDRSLKKYFSEIAESFSAFQKYSKEALEAETLYNDYRTLSDQYAETISQLNAKKAGLQASFYNKFYRYIQEGTWKNDEYMDNDKYFIDALNVSNDSSLPKVTYSFTVFDLRQAYGDDYPGFDLADRTWVEDTEFFGYDADGNPYREEVVITEITYVLDEPDKDSIKVQNHRNQFADLFQKQTATVQSVTYAKGTWDKAASFTDASAQAQASYLQNTLNQAELVLQNAGEQTVVWDKDGITVTDKNSPSQQIRIVGGALLLRDKDGDGLGWKVGITSKGISAKLLTAGQINTSNVQIMNGDEPYFRWDAYGINAYYFERDNDSFGDYDHGFDTTRGVRFDRMGIYGYRNPVDETGKVIDGATWHPNNIDEVRKYSQFALTWDGLFLNLGHSYYQNYYYYNSETKQIEALDKNGDRLKLEKPVWHSGTAAIGKTTSFIYNKWITDKSSPYHGLPYYDPNDNSASTFTKIFSVGGADGSEELAIYDDGTLVAKRVRFTDSVEWTKNASPSRTVYGKISLKTPPEDNTPYSEIPETDGRGTADSPHVWHKIAETKDTVYAHTDDGGATWQGPFLITGRSVTGSEIQYAIDEKGKDPIDIKEEQWSEDFPTEGFDGKCVFTRSRDVYDNEEVGEWSYSVGFVGTAPITLLITTTTGNMYIDGDINATLTVTAHQGNRDITEEFETNAFLWEKYEADGTKDEAWGKRGTSIQISSADVYKKAVFNCVLDVERRVNMEE